MIRRAGLGAAVVGAALVVVAVAGCSSGGLPGGIPGAESTNAAASGGSSSSGGGGCHLAGNTIPAGKYSGDITSDMTSTMNLAVPGAGTLNGAGSSVTTMDGSIHLTSDGKTVTGLIELSGEGASVVGTGVQVHSKTAGDFTGQISGPASAPIVKARMGGAWETLDAPINSGGSSAGDTVIGLHITAVSCTSISGDAIAMFAEAAKPVAAYIKISGKGLWTAARK